MAKPSDFYVGVLDLFGALLPGAVTLGAAFVLFEVPKPLESAMERAELGESSKIAAVLVVAYVAGQVANGVGSVVLDFVFNLLYSPGEGFLSREKTKSSPKRGWAHFLALLDGVFDRGASEQMKALREQLGDTMNQAPIRGVYQGVRAYLKVALPEAFADVERLEADQKFCRALAIGMLLLAVLLAVDHGAKGSPTPFAAFAALLSLRYLSVRRKTIERAYLYFAVRGAAKPVPRDERSGNESAEDEEEEEATD